MKIHAHHDADGITAAYFTQFGVGEVEIVFAEKFGDTSSFEKGDVMVDMRPDNPNIEGLVIDHHLPHPEKRKYELISDIVPASLIAFRRYQDKIPKKEWWKIAIGVCGDGQPHLIPTEVFQEHPSLLKIVKTSASQSYGRWKINAFPIYKLLSSNINAFLRRAEYESAFNLLKYSNSPMMIFTSEDARIAKADVNNNFKSAMLDCEVVNYGNLAVCIFYSKYRMSGYMATKIGTVLSNKTVMAINERNGSLSMRGDLAGYYRDILKDIDYLNVDGHPGFMGGKLSKNYNIFLADLDKIL